MTTTLADTRDPDFPVVVHLAELVAITRTGAVPHEPPAAR
jgi:hypothetical protein